MTDLYHVLEIGREANDTEIKKAFRKAALKYHPDKQEHPSEEATQKFLEIVEAFSVLSNNDLRAAYDKDLDVNLAVSAKNSAMSQKRKDMIEELNLREATANMADPFLPFREEFKEALKKYSSKSEGRTFEDYENIIISSILKS